MLKLVRISDDDKSKMSLSYPASACCAFATEYLGDILNLLWKDKARLTFENSGWQGSHWANEQSDPW
jgi:hypothetical protein